MASSIILLLRSFRDDIARRRDRAWWRMLVVFSALKVILFVAVIASFSLILMHTAPGLLGGLGDESPQLLLSSSLEALFILQMADFYAAIYSVGPNSGRAQTTAYSRALVGAVAARDMRLTHTVTVLPSAEAPAAETTGAAQTLGPLAHPMRALALNDAVYVVAALGAVGVFCLGVTLTVISLRPPSAYRQPVTLADWFASLSFPCVLMLCGAACAVVALVTRRFARMERAGFTALVDASGVTFTRAAGQGRRLRWSDARAFARFVSRDQMGRLHEVFVLSGADEDFLWEALYAHPNASAAEIQREEAWRVAAHRLVEQVALRTGLPLLDLTPTISATLAAGASSSAVVAWNLFARARVIARQQGDLALADDIGQRQNPSRGWVTEALARVGASLGGARHLTPAQRAETLRLARELLPYYPTPAQVTPDPRRRMLIASYWRGEFALQALVIVLIFANALSFVVWPFS